MIHNGVGSGASGVETLGRIPGDIRNPGITPVFPSLSETTPYVQHPYSDASNALFSSYGYYGDYMPKNEFFSLDKYGVNCDGSLVSVPAHTERTGAGWVDVPAKTACKVTTAPVVDMAWVRANLDAKGYTYAISYPMENHGNSRALITWVKACWLPIPGTSPWPVYCWHGMARLEGAPEGWTDQFTPWTGNVSSGPLGSSYNQQTYQHGSPLQDQMATWPEPYRSTSAALFQWSSGFSGTGLASMWAPMGPSMTAVSDDWLSGIPTPAAQLPPIPPYVPPGDPSAINVGDVSSGGGAGNGGGAVLDGRNTLKFDYAAFCNSPAKDGRPRSPSWVSKCLAGQ
jgi:hypothetical protein